eukprot:COSAG06_NODE_478_length_15216_cov_101.587286_12_plen_101_part_00
MAGCERTVSVNEKVAFIAGSSLRNKNGELFYSFHVEAIKLPRQARDKHDRTATSRNEMTKRSFVPHQQGKARRASVASNCVVAICFFSPPSMSMQPCFFG